MDVRRHRATRRSRSWSLYCRRVAGAIGRRVPGDLRRCATAAGGDTASADALADDLGVALQLTNILRDVREDAENGRVYLPAEDLRRFGLLRGDERGATRPALLAALDARGAAGSTPATAARREGRRASSGCARWCASRPSARAAGSSAGCELVPLLDRRSAACVLAMAGIYRRLLERIEARPRAGAGASASRCRRARRRGWPRASCSGAAPVSALSARVVVVGGGLAGIAAALDCADAGARGDAVEVRPRLGGAAYSFERDGLEMDNGQHVFLRCCAAYRALLARLGSDAPGERAAAPGDPGAEPRARALRCCAAARCRAPLHLAGALPATAT